MNSSAALLVAALAAGLSVSEQPHLLPLSDGWAMAQGADIEAGRWRSVELPLAERFDAADDGDHRVWFARDIEVPASLASAARDGVPLALVTGYGGLSYEVWCDGRRLGGRGPLLVAEGAFRPDRRLRNLQVSLPPELLEDGRLSCELRGLMRQGSADAPLGRGVFAMGARGAVAAAAELSQVRYTLLHILPLSLVSLLLTAVALLHLGLWSRRRDLHAVLWYGLYIGSFAFATGLLALRRATVVFHSPGSPALLIGAAISLATVFGVQFSHRLLRDRPPQGVWRGISWLWSGFAVYSLLILLGAPHLPNRFAALNGAMAFGGPLLLSAREAWAGSRDARIIVGGFLGATGAVFAGMALSFKGAASEIAVFGSVLFVLLTMGAALADRYARDLDRLDATRQAALRFVPLEFLGTLGRADILDAQRGDAERIEATVMFSDVRGFTSLAEGLAANEVFELVNAYLGVMQPVIHRHGGVVASYLGDGIMAVFPGGPKDALACGLAQLRALEAFNAARSGEPLRVGLGFHHGPLILGTLGGPDHLECTLIGDTVNLAARIEGMTKVYGSPVLCTEEVLRGLPPEHGFGLRQVDVVRAKGKSEAVGLFDLIDAHPDSERRARTEQAQLFGEAFAEYQQGRFRQARARFERCLELVPGDGAAALYVGRCEELSTGDTPTLWDGVWNLTTK